MSLPRRVQVSRLHPHDHTDAEERAVREAALDRTIEASFPASDPPSTNPNPDDRSALEEGMPSAGDGHYNQ